MAVTLRTAFVLCIAAAGLACSSSPDIANPTVEQRFNRAKELFDDGDYLEAINEFTVITLQYQGSAFAADAQYYLGECRFEREEYILSAFEYSVVRTSYPASPRVPDAHYKMALSYYMQSPKPVLDQQNTRKAIDEFQAFVEYNPAHPLAPDAEEKIKELNGRLAFKAYEAARQYERMEYYRAAILSYDVVIEKYHDTDYAPLAYLDKADLLVKRLRFREAENTIKEFMSRYPNSVLQSRAEGILEKIREELEVDRSDAAGAKIEEVDRHPAAASPRT
ncbi:MAG: uptake lipoprotein [Bacteroidetes bacterium]|nr:uptake lipoprotein [Bacteroidota bacterium]